MISIIIYIFVKCLSKCLYITIHYNIISFGATSYNTANIMSMLCTVVSLIIHSHCKNILTIYQLIFAGVARMVCIVAY